MIFFHLKK